MIPARLSVAVADALPHAAAEATVEPEPPAPGPTAPRRPAPAAPGPPTPPTSHAAAPRGGLRGWLRRPAEYVRAFLTVSLGDQLRREAERAADTAGAVARLEAAALRTDAALAQALAQGAEAAERLSNFVESTAVRLSQVEARQAGLVQLMAEHERIRSATAADQMALARRGVAATDHAVERLDTVVGVLGPRFDELEIKVRPLVEVDADSVAVRTADGYVMLPRSEPLFVTAVANATSGGLEPGVRRVLRALLRPGDACADVGANVGLLTVAMGFAVGPQGRVWAFEPEARVRAQLARTLHLNGLAQVTLSGAAAGAQAGRLTFNESPIIGHSSLYALPDGEQAAARTVEVEVVRLDDVVPPGTALAAVKIDVEGAELDVLAGMRRVVADSRDLAVVAEFGPSHLQRVGIAPDRWFEAFAEHGLSPRLIAEPGGAVSPVAPAELAGVESANLVFVRPGGAADGRLPR